MNTLRSRRQFLAGAGAVLAAPSLQALSPGSSIKAVAFDAFAIFDASSILRLAEELFPGHGTTLFNAWRTRQFEYTWLRNAMHQYKDFWRVTQDALNFAAQQSGVELHPKHTNRLMAAYLELRPWPDVAATLKDLQKRGLRLAILSNMTAAMMHACTKASGLETAFEFHLSTDQVQAFKPDPRAYTMGLEAFRLHKHQITFVAFGGWDAAGAKAFGYPTYWANRLNLPAEELGAKADATHHDLTELAAFLDSL